MFLFREKELDRLNQFFSTTSKKAFAIYGRRRVGKTVLILEFLKKNKGIYFQCASQNYDTCFLDFKMLISSYFPEDSLIRNFTCFKDLFTYLSRIDNPYPVIVIDEFPFLCKKNSDATTEFQWIIDHGLSNLKLILLGSNRSFMQNQISNKEEPLYGRFDEILEVKPFTFSEILTLYPDFEEAMKVFSVTGGVAQYVSFFQEYSSVEQGLDSLFFTPNGRLYQEANNLLRQELTEISTYTSILRAIGGSEKNTTQISKKSMVDSKSVSVYIRKLIELDIVKIVENPLSNKKNDKRYKISDFLFRFHYTFIEPNVSIITALEDKSREYILNERYKEYLGYVYEEVIKQNCFQYALKNAIPFMPLSVGKWWGNIQKDNQWIESEIDLIAYNHDSIIFGECKYKNKMVGIKEFDLLKLKSQFVNTNGKKVYYLLASKNGFSEELKLFSSQLVLIDTY